MWWKYKNYPSARINPAEGTLMKGDIVMVEIIKIACENLIMVGAFLIPLAMMRVADIILGIVIAKKQKIKWDWKKFLWGVFYTICFLLSIALFTTSISMIIPLTSIFGIIIDETTMTALNDINTIAICVTALTITVVSYGKDCFKKIETLMRGNKNGV